MPGAPIAPAAACVLVESTRVSHHGHTGNTRHSPRNGFTAYSALSPGTGLSCPRHWRKLPFANLMPASGHQDHATSPSAGFAPSSEAPPASTASRPAFVTCATPLCGTGRGELVEMICPTGKANIFDVGLDMKIAKMPVGQITPCAIVAHCGMKLQCSAIQALRTEPGSQYALVTVRINLRIIDGFLKDDQTEGRSR